MAISLYRGTPAKSEAPRTQGGSCGPLAGHMLGYLRLPSHSVSTGALSIRWRERRRNEKGGLFVIKDCLVMVFEEVAGATVTVAVELSIPAKKLPHNCGYALPVAL